MKLILVRHGAADNSPTDHSRNLTAEGRSDIIAQTRFLTASKWNITQIRTSPLSRAVQTGKIFQEGLRILNGSETEFITDKRLSPGMNSETAISILSEYQPNDAAVWVFHNPDVIMIASHILKIPEKNLYVTPGTMIAVNLSLSSLDQNSMLIWYVQPEYLPAELRKNFN